MIKGKKLFNYIILAFLFLAVGFTGTLLYAGPQQYLSANAEGEPYNTISNDLPDYFKISTSTDEGKEVGRVDNTIYLFQNGSSKEIVIADGEKEKSGSTEKNYAYFPDKDNNPDEYYFFDFQNSLSLFYNLTNEQIQNGQTGSNLLSSQSIENYASSHDNAFVISETGITPKRLNIKFLLDTANSSSPLICEQEKITLTHEGCYTLVVPLTYSYTNNGGLTYSTADVTLYYTFMIFDSETYFNSTTGLPNLHASANIQESTTTSTTFSRYYFYNYSYGGAVNTLPSISYNPNFYEIQVAYTDIDDVTRYATVVYDSVRNAFSQVNENGQTIAENERFVFPNFKEGKAYLYFTDIGTYDISLTYFYKYTVDQNEYTYVLPLNNLENNTVFKNKNQRLFVFGYQAKFSDYSQINEITNQPEAVELKTFDFENGIYENSADITSAVNNYNSVTNKIVTQVDYFDLQDLQTKALNYINDENNKRENKILDPISTNQTPVKFLTNTNNTNYSTIYKLTKDETTGKYGIVGDTGSAFQGFNQNEAGVYLYVIEYQYDYYMSTSGTLQSAFHQYQILFFEVTNKTPTVTILDENFDDVYTGGYTNKDVYILNNAENNIYDAKVTILVSAYNYKTGKYFFQDIDITKLSAFSMTYQSFAKDDTALNGTYNEKVAGKNGILIEKTNVYSNSLFTIKIISANSSKPSVKTFTIDTNGIEGISGRNVSIASSTTYRIKDDFDSFITNQPMIISWKEKESGAKTYGYVKYVPLVSNTYYSSQSDADNLSMLLLYLVEFHNTLPVSYELDFANATDWTEYSNSKNFDSIISATYVKSNAGIYIVEVYDQAGNSSFEIFMLDNTSPVFVEYISSNISLRKLMASSEVISIPDEGTVTVEWTENKAIYLKNLNHVFDFNAYEYGKDVANAENMLDSMLENFFTPAKNSSLKVFDDLGGFQNASQTYNGTYFAVPIEQVAYISNPSDQKFAGYNGYSYEIDFFDDDNKALEGTHKILLRDSSNTQTTANEGLNYKNYPSGYISFNVTSDASKMMIYRQDNENSLLDFAGFNFTGTLYKENSDNEEEASYSYSYEEGYSESNLAYKFSYYTPISASTPIYLSFIPVADNGSEIDTITLEYYGFEKTEQVVGGEHFFHYDIKDAPDKTLTIFSSNSGKTFVTGEFETFDISLGIEDTPKAGRYVITRTYKISSAVDDYDYFVRNITFIVDEYNLISSLETVSYTDEESGSTSSSLASLVGGDIVLSLYSGQGNSAIEVSFPRINENGLNVGSFYSKDSFGSVDENLTSFSVSGNKLPMTLYIPKYKYTLAHPSNVVNDAVVYSTNENKNLSYYGDAHYQLNQDTGFYDVYAEGIVIESFARQTDAIEYLSKISIYEYEIYAEIEVKLEDNSRLYYYSNGQSENGYLKFYQGNRGQITNSTPVDAFYQTGEYTVTIYQAQNVGTTSEFYKFYKFGFKILSSAPDFQILGNDKYLESDESLGSNYYYTNSPSLTIEWQVPTSIYEAKIDEASIRVVSNQANSSVLIGQITGDSTRSFTIDTSYLLRVNGSYIDITMQYEGFNSRYYSTITKRIYFDVSAPIKNLQTLMDRTENATNFAFSRNYQQIYMRKYFDYNNDEVSVNGSYDFNNFNLSYSYSSDLEPLKYYAYAVNKNYFYRNLTSTLENRLSYLYDTQFVFFRYIDNLRSYQQADKTSFSESKYNNLANFIGSDVYDIVCGYYEIVEKDFAGNMVVYLVYVVDSDSELDSKINLNAIEYTNFNLDESIIINQNDINSGYNIYSNSGFELIDVNYTSDPWSMFTVQIAGQSQVRYLKSPWQDGVVYKVSITSRGIEFSSPISISSIFDGVASSNNKHSITFANRIEGRGDIVYVSIMDASLNTQKVQDPQKTSAILNISVPTIAEVQSTTRAYVYPVNVKIYRFDSTILNADKWKIIMDASQLTYGSWTTSEIYQADLGSSITFSTITPGTTLQIKVSLGINASQKVKYIITDNFGNKTTIIQLANEVSYDEISGNSTIYGFTENDGSLTYISDQAMRFSFNTLLYDISIYDQNDFDITSTLQSRRVDNLTTNVSYFNLLPSTVNSWNDYYKIVIKDSESGEELKTLHLRIYYKLPYLTNVFAEVANGGIIFNDKNQKALDDFKTKNNVSVNFYGETFTTSSQSVITYSQNVTLFYRNGASLDNTGAFIYQNGYGYTVYLSKDNGLSWVNINSETSANTGFTLSGTGNYLILIKYNSTDVFNNICKLFEVEILDSSASYYYLTVDGSFVQKSNIRYTDRNNIEYTTNYIVSVDYRDKNNRLSIAKNEELDVDITLINLENTGTEVYVEIYYYSCSESVGYFTIIYIAETDNIVSSFTYETASGSTSSLKSLTSHFIVANNETDNNFDKLKLSFSSYYGIKQNLNNIKVQKLFNGSYVEIYPTVYQNGDISYVYLTQAGTYRVGIYDSCTPANYQAFRNNNYIEIVFLNSTPLMVTYTDSEGLTAMSDFVQKAVYNSSVKLSLTTPSSYYQPSGYPVITVTRNGKAYSKQSSSAIADGYTESNNSYTFSQSGYYTVKFKATSTTGVSIREEEFNFTIINKNESRYAYEFTNYGNYYISKVFKNDIDITDELVNMTNFDTVIVNKEVKLSEIIINYLDEKTGAGRYKITINPNKNDYVSTSGEGFTFELWINMAKPPINVSLPEGESTSGSITIKFNVQNLYNSVGDCYLVIGNTTRYYTSETLSNYRENESISLASNGTFFVQLFSTNGQLLYSYKITKTEPLNAFAIIAIVIGVAVVGAIVGITIMLRKRQKVK